MSLCVPERDRSGGMLDSLIPSKGLQGHVGGKVDFVRSRKSHYSEVPDQDTLGLDWIDNGHLDMQGQSSKCSKSQWQYSGWNNEQGIEDGVTPSKPAILKSHASLEDVVNDTTTESQHVAHNNNNSNSNSNNIDAADDEMVSWLQYPLDATLERSYCSEFFGNPPESNTQLLKESFAHGVTRTMRPPHSGGSPGAADSRIAAADAAMMLGAGRAAGILPQAGADAFSKVRTLHSMQPSTLKKWNQPMNGSNMVAPTSKTSPSVSPTNPMLPPKMQQPVAPHQSPPGNRPGSMNFSHFSRPAAIVKANLHSLAGSLHPIPPPPPPNNARFKPQVGRPNVEACTSSGSSIVESATARQEEKVQLEATEREQSNGLEDLRWQTAPQMSPVKDLAPGGECKSMSPPEKEACRSQVSLATSSGKGVSHVTQHPDIQEPSITSSSGRYGTGAERPKEASASIKRKSSEREETECQSEDGEDESVDTKKPATGRGGTTKRSRAAEVHNQSERRRRDRINEKMKALQELIPNSNKTDKASMLDEAIEYLKLLQVQLQMMSMRTGTLPPMVVPSGMQQHMQMSQMAAMPSMGMGMGMMPMGLGMGMMDMGVSAQGRAVMPMPSHAGPSMNGNMTSAPNMVDVHDFRYQTPGGVMDSYGAYMARLQQQQQQQQQQQPMQMNPALGMDKYNAYLMQHQMQQQQQQHQQQLQLQPHQQQHQQHQQQHQPNQQQHQLNQQQHQPHQQQHQQLQQHLPNQQQHQPHQQQHQPHQQQHQQHPPQSHPQHTHQQQAANMNGGPPH